MSSHAPNSYNADLLTASTHAHAQPSNWEPILPSMEQAWIRALIFVAGSLERSAATIARAGWLTPLLFAALTWIGLSAGQG